MLASVGDSVSASGGLVYPLGHGALGFSVGVAVGASDGPAVGTAVGLCHRPFLLQSFISLLHCLVLLPSFQDESLCCLMCSMMHSRHAFRHSALVAVPSNSLPVQACVETCAWTCALGSLASAQACEQTCIYFNRHMRAFMCLVTDPRDQLTTVCCRKPITA